MARTPDDNRAAMNVHEAAAGARRGDRGGTFSTVARITRAGPDGVETGAQIDPYLPRAVRAITVASTGGREPDGLVPAPGYGGNRCRRTRR